MLCINCKLHEASLDPYYRGYCLDCVDKAGAALMKVKQMTCALINDPNAVTIVPPTSDTIPSPPPSPSLLPPSGKRLSAEVLGRISIEAYKLLIDLDQADQKQVLRSLMAICDIDGL